MTQLHSLPRRKKEKRRLLLFILPVLAHTLSSLLLPMDSFDCSLEMEPRTLRSEQLDVAREQAVNVLKRETPEEAARIFTKGAKPVEELGRKGMLVRLIQSIEGKTNVSCELYASIGDGGEENLEKDHTGEPLTAPF